MLPLLHCASAGLSPVISMGDLKAQSDVSPQHSELQLKKCMQDIAVRSFEALAANEVEYVGPSADRKDSQNLQES